MFRLPLSFFILSDTQVVNVSSFLWSFFPLLLMSQPDRNVPKLGKVLVPFHSSAQADPGSRAVLVPASGHPQAWEGSQGLAQDSPGSRKVWALGLTGLQKCWQGQRWQGAVKWACEGLGRQPEQLGAFVSDYPHPLLDLLRESEPGRLEKALL